jgi:ABC-type multidrug transport system fused ATPase/permease subunit
MCTRTVLNGGEIVEQGSYKDLMDAKNVFYKMVQAQQLNQAESGR